MSEGSKRKRSYRRLLQDWRWKTFREEVIEIDGGRCRQCGRSEPEAKMHVHHVRYVSGKLPWEYDYADLETLCAGCHAREHGVLPPVDGWELVSETDMGEPSSECELCGTTIRYVFMVAHPKWEPIEVGSVCCDILTGTEEATSRQRHSERRDRFARSLRWGWKWGHLHIKQAKMDVEIIPTGKGARLRIGGLMGRIVYESVIAAKKAAFDVIESGAARRAIEQRNAK